MAKGNNQKLKMLYLAKILMEESDEQHGLTMAEIIEKLNAYDVSADRKTLYLDLEELRRYGMDVLGVQSGRSYYYYLGARDFELPELKLLVDAVQSAKFITDKKSGELIKKLESMVSRYDAGQLHRQVVTSGRVKSMNESIYYNVDKIHESISANRQIRFKYFYYNYKKEQVFRRGGEDYVISPWSLMWDDEKYYLVGYEEQDAMMKHFRVDKMVEITMEETPRAGRDEFDKLDLARYTDSHFGMFSGDTVPVTLEVHNTLAGVLMDRFGKDLMMIPMDDYHFRATVPAVLSGQFYGWVLALGDRVRIAAPEEAVQQMKEELEKISALYHEV